MMRRHSFLLAILLGILFPASPTGQAQNYDYDLIVRNGRILEGSLKPAFTSDIAIKKGEIARIAKSIQGSAPKVINARGLYVSPGFIDLHTHVDGGMYFPENRACLNYLYQGVTTVVVGQCGSSAWNIFEQADDQMKRWSEEGIGPNAALLVGHGTVREIVLGRDNRAPTPEELERMKTLVKEAMEQGAYGLSTGLIYVPGSYSKTDEIIELAKVVSPYGGIYHSHIRNESDRLLDALREAIEIGEKAGVRVHISHFKVVGKENWGKTEEASRLIEEARAKGRRATADQYPFRFSNNYPYSRLIPATAWVGKEDAPQISTRDFERLFENLGTTELIDLYSKATPYIPISERHRQFLEALPRNRLVSLLAQQLIPVSSFRGVANERQRMLFYRRMQNPSEAEAIRRQVKENIERTGADNLIVGICVDKQFEGKSLKEVAAIKGKSPEDTAIELDMMDARIVPYRISEDDIEHIMKKDFVGTGSDGETPFYGIGYPHIRSYLTFLHKINRYVLERKAVSLEHAIRSQTSLPAEIMDWNDRGWIKEGYKADIVIFDLNHLATRSSISNPHQYCKGVQYLLVNGELVIDGERFTGKLAGKVLKLKK